MFEKRYRDIAWIFISNVIARGMGFLFFLIAAILLTKGEFGELKVTIAIASILGIAAFTGFPQSLARYLASDRTEREGQSIEDKAIFYSAGVIGTVSILAVSLILALILSVLSIPILVIILGETVYYFYIGFVRGIFSFWRVTVANFSTGICKVLFLVSVIFLVENITSNQIAIIFGLSYLVPIVVIELVFPSRFHFELKSNIWFEIKDMFRFSLPIIFANLLFVILFSFDIIIVQWRAGIEEAGSYGVSKVISQLFLLAPLAMNTVMMPIIAQANPDSLRKAISLLRKPIAVVVAFSLLGIAVLILFQNRIISFFGTEFLDASESLIFLAIAMSIYSCYIVLESFLIGIGKPRLHMISLLVGTFVFLALCFAITPYPTQKEISIFLMVGCSATLIAAIFSMITVFEGQSRTSRSS